MQITFDTATATAPELRMLQELIGELYRRTTSSIAAEQAVKVTVQNKAQPALLPAADLPSTGTDTTQMGFAAVASMPAPNTGASPLTPLAPVIPLHPVTPPAPAAGGAVQLDAKGLPWDARIHSSTQKLTDKGVWQMRRGVSNDHALIQRVEAELRATLPSATPAPTNVAPVFPQPTVTPAAAPAPALVPLPLAPLATPMPSAAPLAPIVLPAPSNMQEFMQQVAPLMQAGKVNADTITMACMQNSLPGMPALTTAAPEQIAAVWASLPK